MADGVGGLNPDSPLPHRDRTPFAVIVGWARVGDRVTILHIAHIAYDFERPASPHLSRLWLGRFGRRWLIFVHTHTPLIEMRRAAHLDIKGTPRERAKPQHHWSYSTCCHQATMSVSSLLMICGSQPVCLGTRGTGQSQAPRNNRTSIGHRLLHLSRSTRSCLGSLMCSRGIHLCPCQVSAS